MKCLLPVVHQRFSHERLIFLDPIATQDPEIADFILFIIPCNAEGLRFLRNHSLYKAFPEKCRQLSGEDRPIEFLRGLSCATGFPYWHAEDSRFDAIAPVEHFAYLASFLGGSTSFLRKRLFRLSHPEEIRIEDTSAYHHWNPKQDSWEAQRKRYDVIIQNSLFVLCPRGASHNSYRIYESMQSSRVPVIIDDRWSPPMGIPWENFSLRIKENEIHKLKSLLEPHRDHAAEMGKIARQNWERYIRSDNLGKYLIDSLETLGPGKPPSAFRQSFRLHRTNLLNGMKAKVRKVSILLLKRTPLSQKLHLNRS